MNLSSSSASFLREQNYIEIVTGGREERVRALEDLLIKNDDNTLVYPKKRINETMQKFGIEKHIVKNALHLQNYNADEIKDILADFANYLTDNGLVGILEFHPNDTTQNSYHFHYYTDDDSKRVHDLMDSYIINNGYANKDNIDIQGKYDSFKDKKDTLPKAEYEEIKEEAKKLNREVKKADNVIMTEDMQEQREIKESIYDILKRVTQNTNKTMQKYKSKADEFKSKLSKIPKTDTNARIQIIKDEIKRTNKNRR